MRGSGLSAFWMVCGLGLEFQDLGLCGSCEGLGHGAQRLTYQPYLLVGSS